MPTDVIFARSRADVAQLVEQRFRNSPNEFVLKFAHVDRREFSWANRHVADDVLLLNLAEFCSNCGVEYTKAVYKFETDELSGSVLI